MYKSSKSLQSEKVIEFAHPILAKKEKKTSLKCNTFSLKTIQRYVQRFVLTLHCMT